VRVLARFSWLEADPCLPRSIFDKALEVCLRVTKDLGQLNLSAEDRALLAGSHGSSLVINRIRTLEKDILARAEKGKKAKRAADLANGFCEVAARLSPMLQVMIPQSPEYAVPFGCLTLLFKVST
jgi:hypothetical protein